jgi:hypothetical protein
MSLSLPLTPTPPSHLSEGSGMELISYKELLADESVRWSTVLRAIEENLGGKKFLPRETDVRIN